MLGNIGITEIIIVFVVALIIFGPKKLPEMGKAIGSAVTEFKKGLSSAPPSDSSDPAKITSGDTNKQNPAG